MIVVLFTCFQFYESRAQERKLLDGVVLIDSTGVAGGIHVVNLSAETGASTDANGNFRIMAKTGDTLFFSSIQFQHKRIIIEQSSFNSVLKVKLVEKFNELDEVQLDDIRLSGFLSEDLDKVPKSIYEKLGMPFPKPRRSSLELAAHSARNGGSISTIINALNGKLKQIKKAEENHKRTVLVEEGLSLVGKSLFKYRFGLPEEEIINFLYFCTEDNEYSTLVASESIMELLEFFESKIDSFKALRELH
ncbi:hypothetical protein ML462_12920 [Gramella lutea]|uniref:Uncharacterized protein n=1 Tax=Christiangramia lutea TaxID=1607951 RepID=A0A9X1V4M2_9FLAO|nr:hypothetical protein [Christiangramia lutea]MCH4824073.1 hypothetical protein [Christiangramia lutea]